jgi:hypothetical protein
MANDPTFTFATGGTSLNVNTVSGLSTVLNITAATVVKAAPGRAMRVSVLVAGSTTGTVNDCLTTGAATAANTTYVIPTAVGMYTIEFPHSIGVVVVPGTGHTLAVSYN